MPLLEVQTVNKITATIALDESIAQKVDQYALFINAPSDEVVSKALDYVFSKDKDFLSFAQSVDGKKPEHPLRIRKPMEAAEKSQARTALDSTINSCPNTRSHSQRQVVVVLKHLGRVGNGAAHRKDIDTPPLRGSCSGATRIREGEAMEPDT